MAKYDVQLGDLKNKLASASSILIVVPGQITVDKLASSLALFLSLEQLGKQVDIISEGTVLVAHSNLYGVGKVKSALPQIGGGDFTLTLEGVVAPDGTVPSLEKLDWFPEGANLNLVFHVLPGQKFQPSQIVPKYQSSASSSSLVFVIGAANLNELGGIYTNNQQAFSGSFVVNLDNNSANTNFGQVNVVDPAASASEIVAQVFNSLGLNQNSDIASNILTGVYNFTNNLTANVNPDTFIIVGQAMQAGGKVPTTNVNPMPNPSGIPALPPMPEQPVSQPQVNVQPQVAPQTVAQPAPVQVQPEPLVAPQQNPLQSNPFMAAPPNIGGQDTSTQPDTSNPSPDWLTPKVYKGTSLG